MSLNLSSNVLTLPAERTPPPSLRRGAMSLLALARRLRPVGMIRPISGP